MTNLNRNILRALTYTDRAFIARGLDDRAAEANLAVVDHQVLAGSRRPLRRLEARAPTSIRRIQIRPRLDRFENARRIRHPVTRLRRQSQRSRWRARDPVHRTGFNDARIQPPIAVSLHDQQSIALLVLACNEPWLAAAAVRPANSQSLPLAKRVVSEALMASDNDAFRRSHRP